MRSFDFRRQILFVALVLTGAGLTLAQADPFVGEIRFFAGNFAPSGWKFCDGQLLQIDENQALFSILGTTYGGDGHTTFALPDMRGRSPVHTGQGPGLSNFSLGRYSGQEAQSLSDSHLPVTHDAASGVVSKRPLTEPDGGSVGVPDTQQASPVPVRDPSLAVNCIIAVQGIFPSQD